MKNKLFKWIGGKSWLSKELNKEVLKFKRKNIKLYIEPFAGGLGSFVSVFESLKKIGVEEFHLNDINTPLINTYNFIKNKPEDLLKLYFKIESDYSKLIPESTPLLHKIKDKNIIKKELIPARDFYNSKKSSFNLIKNKNTIESAALFLFITQHNFNGIYRENLKGEFNVSYNWETRIISEEKKRGTIMEHSHFFNSNNIFFYNIDCFDFLKLFNKDETLIYLDPPYINENSKENNYNQQSFSKPLQILLLDEIKDKPNFIFSNHQHDIFKQKSKEEKYKMKTFLRRNFISQNPETRSEFKKEVLLINNK